MPNKPKNADKNPARDEFYTPDYATNLGARYLDKSKPIWEYAAGSGKMARRLRELGFTVFASTLGGGDNIYDWDFLNPEPPPWYDKELVLVTNDPFSKKESFYKRRIQYGNSFAVLVPAEYHLWGIGAIKNGCEKVIPERRIDYLTPNILINVHEGEVFRLVKTRDKIKSSYSLSKFKKEFPIIWDGYLEEFPDLHLYKTIDETPNTLLARYSTAQFHSMWLMKGAGLGRTETFVELTKEMKLDI